MSLAGTDPALEVRNCSRTVPRIKEEDMADFNNLTLEVADEIAVLSITRPAALNALNSETLDEIDKALTDIEARDDVKVLILTGGPDKKGNAFKSFVAGADISEMVNFTAPEARAFGIKASVPFFKLMNMRQITIAAVNGFALGGGCEIAMACDIRIASENAIFGQPETGLGIIPGFGGTQRLARLVGMGRAKEMIFTCDNIDAAEAYRIGLVNKVVPAEELMETAKKMAGKIASKGSYANAVAKAAINNGYDMDIKNAVEMEANLFGVVNDTHDKKEGMGAFLEKRAAELTDF
jgi:enoyl-CoA hydratase